MSNSLSLSAQIESLLFFEGGSLTVRELAESLAQSPDVIRGALDALSQELNDRGVSLVQDGDRVSLTTSRDAAALIERLRRSELEGPIGKAGLETLAVIVYRGPVTRADIEYVRGVNVSTTLRALLIRGLIERIDNPKDKRSFLYQATVALPAFLGVRSLSELPNYEAVRAEIQSITDRPTETV